MSDKTWLAVHAFVAGILVAILLLELWLRLVVSNGP